MHGAARAISKTQMRACTSMKCPGEDMTLEKAQTSGLIGTAVEDKAAPFSEAEGHACIRITIVAVM